jgi:hypothetical protein
MTGLADLATALDHRLPRGLAVRRQQAVYWPSILAQSLRADMGGSLCVNGFPSSGTNWLCQLASRYFGIPIFEPWRRFTPTLGPHVFHLHRFVDRPAVNRRTLYIVRDGRDAVVSRYFKLGPNPVEPRPLRAFEAASGLVHDHARVREQLPAFIRWYFTAPRYSAMNWAVHVRQAAALGLLRVSFEALKQDAAAALAPVFAQVAGRPVDRDRLAAVVAEMDFARVRTAETAFHKRKSQVGEWREMFTRDAAEVFAGFAQAELEAMGYEADRGWIGQLAAT